MRLDTIKRHEDVRKVGIVPFLRAHWDVQALGHFPDPANAQNTVQAEVNHGRWIVVCPNQCGGAMLASEAEPLYVCPDCGSPENGGQFYRVQFPAFKEKLEAALVRRPRTPARLAPTRNWKPGETLEDIEAETARHERPAPKGRA